VIDRIRSASAESTCGDDREALAGWSCGMPDACRKYVNNHPYDRLEWQKTLAAMRVSTNGPTTAFDRGVAMIIEAVTFAASDQNGGLVALAVLCPLARHCSTISKLGSSPTRHFVTPEEWKLIEQQVAAGLAAKPLSSDSAIAAVLDDILGVWSVQWLGTTPLRVARPEETGAALDQHLATSLEAYRSGPRLQDKAS
jgi:hypothetical protein